MYSEYFGLDEMPFSIAPDPRYLYMSEQHREALAHLIYGINSDGGFVLLTGEVGAGKTTVCRCLLEQIPEKVKVAFIINPKLTVKELLATICDEFGIQYPEDNASIKAFVDLINAYLLDIHSKGFSAVLIIDEAQNLSTDILEQLRLLTNLETNQRKLLQIILLGQPELKNKLSKPELRQLAQRITARYHLGPLSKKDLGAYVAHRLSVAGIQTRLFPQSTIVKLFKLSGGVPRLINLLCDRAMLGAFVQGQAQVNKPVLLKAAREVFGEPGAKNRQRKISIWLLAILVIILLGTVFVVKYYKNNSEYSFNEPQPIAITPEQPPGLDTLQRPVDMPNDRGKIMAYQALFKQWNITYQPHEYITACQQAKAHGLRCLHKLGSLGSLRRINRPAVLRLFDDQGQELYATLTSLSGETATFVIGAETRTIAVKDLELLWLGNYTLLWQVPPGYQGDIQTGNQGPSVQWLDKQLAHIQGRTAQPRETLFFDDKLASQVKKFQLVEGLVPDGIAGTKTLIHLNTSVGSGIPKLTENRENE